MNRALFLTRSQWEIDALLDNNILQSHLERERITKNHVQAFFFFLVLVRCLIKYV